MNGWRRFITILVVVALVVAALYLLRRRGGGEGIDVTFLGGAMEVGGSCTLVSGGGTDFLVDCGAFGDAGNGVIPDHPDEISFMILTHAHTDHCGKIPQLFAAGFDGEIYCTTETAELAPIMIKMSRSFDRNKVSKEDFNRSLAALRPVPFDEKITAGPATFVFRPAQHLLGAAFVEIEIDTGHRTADIIFSGDLGSGGAILLPILAAPSPARYVVVESTYGGKTKYFPEKTLQERYGKFGRAVGGTLRDGGDVLIPAFTLGRTQEVIAALDMFIGDGTIPAGTEIYSDSPTAKKVSDVFRNHPESLSATARSIYGDEILKKSWHREVKSKTAMKVHGRDHRPTIFISSSGDLQFANSPRHLARMAEDEKNLLCIVGWQSYGSVGRKLVEGDSTVCLRYREDGETKKVWIAPALKIERFREFSSHADREDLLEWVGSIDGLSTAFIVHGEPESSEKLSVVIERKFDIKTKIPEAGETIFLPSR
jgi:metallo-beta-lactamase family protein